jgi:hypothetical protein
VHKAVVKPVQISLVFVAQIELCSREVTVQQRGIRLFATVALCVPVSSSAPYAVALTCPTRGVAPLTYRLELVAFDFPSSTISGQVSLVICRGGLPASSTP